ncbi:hypothetical protein DJ021_10770 [Phenylobacterium hankyongense]|uniref:DUF6644 domain-containing protein n=1 Tax=Phenylobacterium hankyongense TaxID=1813876 RepID=A0A328AYP1_9CAUL|nr:DUF6644 family protein [Phenylobacterium hankyongense]RAK60252.1 hypothetical protein DJ021_10770 [Phenylobacterium hankyongense]
MTFGELLKAIEATPVATALRESGFLFPAVETAHVLAITLVVGTIAIVDFRLLGVPGHTKGVRRLTADVLPFTWGAFAVALISGALLFASAATKYWADIPFRMKMVLLVLAGLNMVFFHLITWRSVHVWDEVVRTPFAAKIAGATSLLLWIGVVLFGRWIGFTVS